MNLDPAWLFLSLVIGAVGFALFLYGKRESRWPHALVGVLFMIYPYFTPGVKSLIVVGALLALGLWYLVRSGH